MPEPTLSSETPSLSAIRDEAQEVFAKRPCLWQLQVAEAFLRGDRYIVCIAGTGMGKTLTFWLPLLFHLNRIQIVVTPLNQLGQQNVDSLCKAGIQSIAINAEIATWNNFRAIENLKYQAIIVSPKQLMKSGGEFKKLLVQLEFVSHIIGFVFDEAHCIMSWGEFRLEYKELQWLHYIISRCVPYLIASATFTPESLSEVKKTPNNPHLH
ncbi:P-loop containing nucleoside triphosphate hydrolase protein [Gyrodon lividus]|nr:P-loop containing nucleoside triphosphate hydrolase protein [Gyrodon lividus]